jgi:membrane peptidoglycan carboxypeptidase
MHEEIGIWIMSDEKQQSPQEPIDESLHIPLASDSNDDAPLANEPAATPPENASTQEPLVNEPTQEAVTSEPAQTPALNEPSEAATTSESTQVLPISEPAQTPVLNETSEAATASESTQVLPVSEPAKASTEAEPTQVIPVSEPPQTPVASELAQTPALNEHPLVSPAKESPQIPTANETSQTPPVNDSHQIPLASESTQALPTSEPPASEPPQDSLVSEPIDEMEEDFQPLIPLIPQLDKQTLYNLRRMRHRRKRFTLYVLRTHRRRQAEDTKTRANIIWGATASIMLVVVLIIGGLLGWAINYYQQEQNILSGIQAQVNDSDSVRIYDMHGTLLYQFNDNGVKHSVCYDQMPRILQNATVAIEDKSFWTNTGVDYQRIVSAAVQDYASHQTQQGASTITQQLIKNVVLDNSPNFDRKIREAILAFGLTATNQYTKQQIMAMYLNTVPYGPDIYGVDEAAQNYFGYTDDQSVNPDCSQTNHNGHVAAEHLTLAQATFLAGIPQNPIQNDPRTSTGFQHALERQNAVLKAMVEQKYITQAQADAVEKESHSLDFIKPEPPTLNLAPHFVEYVRDHLTQMIDAGQLPYQRSGLNVYTTLDLPLQNRVQAYLKEHLFGNEIDEYGTHYRDDKVSQAAAMIVQTGTNDIRVMLGSWDYNATQTPYGKPVAGQVNVLTQSFRQVGSTFKAIDYTAAFEKGWFPAMTIADDPTVFPVEGSNGTAVYKPLDAERTATSVNFLHQITVRTGLQLSLNIPAVKATEFVGISDLQNMMARLGITNYLGTPGLSMGIGGLDIHIEDLIHAYSVLANYGYSKPFNAIDHITDSQGNAIYNYVAPRGTQVIDPGVAFLTTSVLSDNNSRVSNVPMFGFGDCSPLRLFTNTWDQCHSAHNPGIDYHVASKTGTTDNLTNDLAMGYTTDYIGGAWVGNTNESDPMYHIAGISGAAPIWNRMMLMAEGCKDDAIFGPTPASGGRYGGTGNADGCQPTKDFPVPSDVVRATFSSNGKTTTDWFLSGNVPKTQGIGNGSSPITVCNYNADSDNWTVCGGGGSSTQPPSNPGNGGGGGNGGTPGPGGGTPGNGTGGTPGTGG